MNPLEELLDRMRGRRLCVIGDLLLDTGVNGRVERLSPEAPVPVLNQESLWYRASGAGITAQSVTQLCAGVTVVGVTGDDDEGRRLEAMLADGGVTPRMVRDRRRPTPHKTRFHSGAHPLLRVDRECTDDLDAETEARVLDLATGAIAESDAIVVSDYAKGTCTATLLAAVTVVARRARVPLVVDPKRDSPGHYSGGTVLTPNLRELAGFARAMGRADQPVPVVARELRVAGGFEWVVVTKDVAGLSVVGPGPAVDVPSYADRLVDVAGAGDVVAATVALGLAAGGSAVRAAVLGSLAAAISVRSMTRKCVDAKRLRDDARECRYPC